MRGITLLRAARQAVQAAEPLGWGACGSASSCSSGSGPLRQLSALLGLSGQLAQQQPRHQLQQRAGLAAAGGRRRDDDETDEEEPGLRHNRLKHSARKLLIDRKLAAAEEEQQEEQAVPGEEEESEEAAAQRQHVIRGLLKSLGQEDTSALKFVDSFFDGGQPQEQQQAGAAAAAAGVEQYRGEGGRYAAPGAPLEGAGSPGEGDGGEEEEVEAVLDDDALLVSTPDELDQGEELNLKGMLAGLRPGSRRVVLDKLLSGEIMRSDPAAMAEWQAIQEQYQPPADFRMKVVDVNRTCKGTSTGGLYRYGCMVVVGNGNGVLGWGQGKAGEVNDAVNKAYLRACRNLFPVPRYADHTIPEPIKSKFGQVKLTLYPKASGNGIMANALLREICKMAGIHDVGIKQHGSRNVRNAVKCLFKAFDKMRTEEQIAAEAVQRGSFVVKMPPGRYRNLRG